MIYRNNRVYVRKRHNFFWAQLKVILGGTADRGLKWFPGRAPENICAKNTNCIAIVITLEGIKKLKLIKMTTKQSE